MPLLLSTWSFSERGAARAWPALAAKGSALDAVLTVCDEAERDPAVDSVGYGGLPDRRGDVTLDASVMLAPNRCGSVCAMRHHLGAAAAARAVMDGTHHIMLAGDGADLFAEQAGLPASDLCSPAARERWQTWKSDGRGVDQSRDAGLPPAAPPPTEETIGHDTIGALALDASGTLAGACSTSGTAFKRPGRVGDSPIIGHGLYVDPDVGAATATGTGEYISGVCCSFLVVERMRNGATPEDAITEALERMQRSYTWRRGDQAAIIAVTPDGQWSAGSVRDGFRVVVATSERGIALCPPAVILEPDHHVSE